MSPCLISVFINVDVKPGNVSLSTAKNGYIPDLCRDFRVWKI